MHLDLFSLTLMLPAVKTKTMASSRCGNEDPDAFTDDNLRSKMTGDSTKFALSVLKEFMNARDVDILSLAVEELKQLFAVSKPESEIMSNFLSLSFKNLFKP
jgi:hypothetical protein